MPRCGDNLPKASEDTATELRYRAQRVLRLARELVNTDDTERMRAYASELEQRAAEAEEEAPQYDTVE